MYHKEAGRDRQTNGRRRVCTTKRLAGTDRQTDGEGCVPQRGWQGQTDKRTEKGVYHKEAGRDRQTNGRRRVCTTKRLAGTDRQTDGEGCVPQRGWQGQTDKRTEKGVYHKEAGGGLQRDGPAARVENKRRHDASARHSDASRLNRRLKEDGTRLLDVGGGSRRHRHVGRHAPVVAVGVVEDESVETRPLDVNVNHHLVLKGTTSRVTHHASHTMSHVTAHLQYAFATRHSYVTLDRRQLSQPQRRQCKLTA